jgi:hypothetical protein
LEAWLVARGWTAVIAWGRAPGIDIVASRGGRTWHIEAKGEHERYQVRRNYFFSVVGDIAQRMEREDILYSLALPDTEHFRGLWNRLPDLAKRRLQLSTFFSTTITVRFDAGGNEGASFD